MPYSPLSTYLEDHLAGATAGVALARRVAEHSNGARTDKTLSEIAREIEADRETLKRVMAELGVRGSIVKNSIAWAAERMSRLKPNGRLGGDPRMQRLHELEALSLGIAGKLALWEALRIVPEPTAFAEIDLDELAARARDQRERVERERTAAARAALSPRSNVVRLPEHTERNADVR
jgi:hypothetical protein